MFTRIYSESLKTLNSHGQKIPPVDNVDWNGVGGKIDARADIE